MKIENMLTTIDNYAATQGDQAVYDVLGEHHTYADLKHDSDAVAAYIDGLNLPAKAPVMVLAGQEYEALVTFVGLSKSGHAYIPVDINSANERLTSILEIAQPAAIVAVDPLPIDGLDIPVVEPQKLRIVMQADVDYQMEHAVSGDDNYYIIFTSGTTGKPKGVQISHNNLLSFTNWMITAEAFSAPKQPQMLAQPPYSFDLSVMYWAPTLALGGTLYALPRPVIEDFKQLFAVLPDLPIEVWTSTPSFADMVMLSDDFNAEKMPQIKYFYFDGEELTVSTAQRLRERFPDARIVNAYGPTEATVALSAVAITDEMLASGERLPIGYTKPDSPTYILDLDGNEVPNGEKGEIVVTGPAVSKGYLNNPEKTATAFFEYNGQPAYHTGDYGIMDDDGLLHYAGRMDFQIKFNGYRIELEEVSHILNLSDMVESAVAVPRYNDQHKVQQLLAYVVPKPGLLEQYDKPLKLTQAIKATLSDDMMPYMMPSRFIYRDELPLTPNGKVDIKALIAEVNKS
ncbi:D-alanine--poly(phosphoribitol) ligase subunit 1 [Weissella uvarum]|uniref:D-alanine--poly(phosphoribitol) ligase subunit DltA n=1 Tax=Weissella uvarum TaxID=1479233 RepID=UPI0019615BAE|nr:D-alanine--poly(phosphoribitol) ligase subunit DltA [Weissella uvarum]MBM7616597.1 D-alanine--poly(phosphoribitol) ligase subunit 1 [Weissella uvarum]MCM0594944.1 D-alanine--poly(phosphoribitol) ligase subunit DltA [Weissella uvarum]